jgi:hypothetical protein
MQRSAVMTSPSIFVADDDETYVSLIHELLIDAGYPRVSWHVGDGAWDRIRDELLQLAGSRSVREQLPAPIGNRPHDNGTSHSVDCSHLLTTSLPSLVTA